MYLLVLSAPPAFVSFLWVKWHRMNLFGGFYTIATFHTHRSKLYIPTPQDAPNVNACTPHSGLQTKRLPHRCPLPPLVFTLYLNALFYQFFTTTAPQRTKTTSCHAYIDDILMRGEDADYIAHSPDSFDTHPRACGLDINVLKKTVV